MENKNNKPKIRAILADAGNILFDDTDVRGALKDYLEEKEVFKTISFKKFEQIYTPHRERAYTDKNYSRNEAHMATFEELGIKGLYTPFLQWFEERKKQNKVSILPGVKETLKSLKEKGIDFIIISDGSRTGKNMYDWFGRMGLSEGITDLITSKDLGYCKPDLRFYQFAMKKHNLTRNETVFIGHDLDELEGAKNAGLRTIAYRYDKQTAPLIPYATKIKRFEDLLKII